MILPDRKILAATGLLLVAVLVLYLPVLDFQFLPIGDPAALFENSLVRHGFSLHDLPKILAVEKGQPWQPLPMLAHATAFHFIGAHAGAHHFINVVVHFFNALLFFLILFKATNKWWNCIFAALFFALLPGNVEPVAWIAQLRVLLCAMFCLVAIYLHILRAVSQTLGSLVPVILCHFLALLCGPEAIVLPLLLLIVDYWPLDRMSLKYFCSLLEEKWPLFLISVFGLMLISIPYFGLEKIFGDNHVNTLINSLVHHFYYLCKVVWPNDLSVHYQPFRELFIHAWLNIGVIPLVIICLAFVRGKGKSVTVATWVWFFVTLAGIPFWLHNPEGFTLADRHLYIPSMGLAWGLAWLIPRLSGTMDSRKNIVALACVMALLVYGITARAQLNTWRDDRALFLRSLHFHRQNVVSLTGLGNWLHTNNFPGLAKARYSQALEVNPNYAPAHYHLGNALAAEGNLEEALTHYREAIRSRPGYVRALNQLGNTLLEMDRPEEAVLYLQAAVAENNELEVPRLNLANALVASGRPDLAEGHYRDVLSLRSNFGEANAGLATALAQMGRLSESITFLEENLAMGYNEAHTHFALGDVCFQMGDFVRAIPHFRKAIAARPDYPRAYNSLGAALLMRGQVQGAVESFSKAIEQDPSYEKAKNNLEYALSLPLAPAGTSPAP